MATHLKVFLLTVAPDRRVFYSEMIDDGAEAPRHRGLRGWAEERFHRMREGWQHSRSGAARLTRGVWELLQERTHPDEALLARLRSAGAIEVHHPPSMTAGDAQAAWSRFLDGGRRRHWPWLVVNLLVSPLTVVLAPLPGPNLIGYWFVYRALHHLLILVGLGRVRSGRVETRFRPAGELKRPIGRGTAESEGDEPATAAARLESLGCDPRGLLAFLERQGVPSADGGGRAGRAVGPRHDQ